MGVPAPAIKHSNWRFLLRQLTSDSRYRALASLSSRQLEMALAMPVAVARWIALFHPELKDLPQLNIVIAGAEVGFDAVDEGRWYQMIPTLLGASAQTVKVTLVGPHLNKSTRTGAPPVVRPWAVSASAARAWAPADKFVGTLGEYATQHGLANMHMVVLSHPGMDTHAGDWLAPGELEAPLKAGIPVAMLEYAAAELEQESWIFDLYGYSVLPQFDQNPFALEDEDAVLPSATAAILSEIGPYVPPPEFRPDPAREALHSEYVAWTQDMYREGYLVGDHDRGQLLDVPNLGEVVRVPAEFLVRIETGDVYVERENGELLRVTDLSVPAAMLKEFPDTTPLPFDRSLWVMRVAKYLENALQAESE